MTTSEATPGPTLEQVAAVAGVSKSTVSRVINGSSKVSGEAREAVELAIETLGYVPNRAARSLVTRRSESIALVVTEPETRLFSEPFFAGITRGVSNAISDTDLQLVLLMAPDGPRRARLERYLMSGHADGVLLLSLHGDDPLPQRLVERGLTVVMGGRPASQRLSFVDADNVGGARSATAYLLTLGRQQIGTITGPLDMAVGRDRLDGYRSALDDAGMLGDDALVEPGDFTQPGGAHAMRELLRRRPHLDAVFAASDLMAAGAMRILHDTGRRVPQDVAVIGFDDSIVATSSQPPLSTIRQPVERMGAEMVRLLLAHLEGSVAPPQQLILATELVLRAST